MLTAQVPGEAMWRDVVGALGVVPGLALTVLLAALTAYVVSLMRHRNGARHAEGGGDMTAYLSAAAESRGEMRKALDGFLSQLATISTVLNGTAIAMGKVVERLEHMPTKAELGEGLKEVRQGTRDGLQRVLSTVEDARDRLIGSAEEDRRATHAEIAEAARRVTAAAEAGARRGRHR